MAHIPYADTDAPEVAALVERIVRERGSVLHLYAMLLHSPPLAEGWLSFLTSIRQRCSLPAAIRELMIIEIAHLNGARYEAEQHWPIALSEGLTEAQLDCLPDWLETGLFDARSRSALAYCDAMTRSVQVSAVISAALRRHFDHREIIELTATIAAYNMVSRFIVALGVESIDTVAANPPR